MDIRPVRDEATYDWALREIAGYFEREPDPGTPEADRFDVLAALIGAYEARRHPVLDAAPVDVIRLVMEQRGLGQPDLARVLGSRSRASEVLSGGRDLTLGMIRALRDEWGVPADALVPRRMPEPA